MSGIVVSARGIYRSFGAVQALRDVALDLHSGEIHAICGENGAGKSTMMAILAGSLQPDRGELRLDGAPFAPPGPAEAAQAGIGIVYQERSLLPNLSVAENICIGTDAAGTGWLLNRAQMRERANALLEALDPGIEPHELVGNLGTARQQVVEIAKALARRPKILILDEPTSSIGSEATTRLFSILRRLRSEGLAIVYISHHLDEIFDIADRVTVLRDGEGRGTWLVSEMDEQRLVSEMVGRTYSHTREERRAQVSSDGHALLEVGRLTSYGLFYDIDLEVRKGEIVALTGLVGAGRTEAGEGIFGTRTVDKGRVSVAGVTLPAGRPDISIAKGLGMLTEDRKEGGLFTEMSLQANIAAPNLKRLSRLYVNDDEARDLARKYLLELRIRAPSIDTPVSSLSGGNQQKVLLAMWLATKPKVLIVDEPTKGVDVGAKDEIHRILASLAEEGTGILLISSDQAEIHRLADRVLVMRRGRIVTELAGDVGEEEVVAYASGAKGAA